MRTRFAMASAAVALALVAAGIFGACAGPKSAVTVHPEKVQGSPICTGCHDASRAALDHTPGWMTTHGAAAVREQRTCDLCHRPSSCADCHGNKEEIKPSDKRSSRFDAETPHRGDYLTRHRIDGRLDPASCFPCHGRKNDQRCRVCHQ